MVSYGAYVLGGRMEALFLTLYISIEFDLKKQKPWVCITLEIKKNNKIMF